MKKELGTVNHYTVVLEFSDIGGPGTWYVCLIVPGCTECSVKVTLPEFAAMLAMAETARKDEIEMRMLLEHIRR